MSPRIPSAEESARLSSMLAAEMAAALFDNACHSSTIRKATREWIDEQRATGYVQRPRDTSWSGWTLTFLPFVALIPIAWVLLR